MADSRHIIDIILKARDQTAAAFASATASSERLEQAEKRLEDQNKRTGDSFRHSLASMEDQRKQIDKNRDTYKRFSDEAIQAEVRLANAARTHRAAMADAAKSDAERAAALRSLQDAEKVYASELQNRERMKSAFIERTAKARAAEIRTTNEQAQAEDNLLKSLQQSANARDELHRREMARAQERRESDKAQVQAFRQRAEEEMQLQQKLGDMEEREHEKKVKRWEQEEEQRVGILQEISEATERFAKSSAEAEEERIRRTSDAESRRHVQSQVQERERLQNLAELSKATDDYRRKVEGLRRLEIREGRARQRDDRFAVQEVQLDRAQAIREAEELREVIQERLDHLEGKVDFDVDPASVAAVEAARAFMGRDINAEMKIDVDKSQIQSFTQSARNMFKEIGEGFGNSGNRIAAFDNLLRGLFSFLVVGFLQPLIVMAGAAGAALLALGSSAMFAGGALAGGLAAGAAQAIPMLGVLVAYVMRLKAVMDVVSQQNLLNEQQSYAGAANNKKLADTTDAVASATDGLKGAMLNVAQAHDRVGEAQKRLVEARREAVRQLEDLILAERRAELAAQGAVLSQQEAQQALREAIASGGAIEQEQLGVQEAGLGVDESQIDLRRARQDAGRAQRGGIEGMPGVVSAKQQLEQAVQAVDDANRAVDNAQRSLEKAKRGADIAGAGMTAAAGKLAFLQQQLSPAERKLAQVLQRVQTLFRETAQRITEPMIGSTIRVLTRVENLIKNSGIVRALRGLSGEMGKQMERFFGALTNERSMGQFMGFIREAKRNLAPLTGIFINLTKTFMNIAEAAAPALRQIWRWLRDITAEWSRWTGSQEGQSAMIDFFKEGVVHLKAWAGFFGSIIKLFAAIAGPGGGANAGLELIQDATRGINRLTDNIRDGGKAAKFFRDLWHMMKETFKALGPVFESIGREIQKSFGEGGIDAVKGFSTFMADVLVPAIGDFIRLIGGALAKLGEFLRAHPQVAKMAATFMGMSLAFGFFAKFGAIFGPITSAIGALGKFLIPVVQRFMLMARAMGGVRVAFAALGGPIALIVAAVLFLITKLELWDEVWEMVKRTIMGFWEGVKPGIEELLEAFGMIAESIGLGGSGGIMGALKPFAEFLFSVLTPVLEFLAKVVGTVLALSFKSLATTIKILSLPMRVFFKIITGGFDGLKEVVGEVIGFILDRIDDMLGVIQGILEMAGKLPFVGDKFDGMAEAVGNAREDVRGLADRMRGIDSAAAAGTAGAKRHFKDLGDFWDKMTKPGIDSITKGIRQIGGLGPTTGKHDIRKQHGRARAGSAVPEPAADITGQLGEEGANAKVTVAFGDALIAIEDFSSKFRVAWGRMWTTLRERTERAVKNINEAIARLGGSINRIRRRFSNAEFGIDFDDALKAVRRFRAAFGSHWAAMWAEVRKGARQGRKSVVDDFREMVNDLDKLSDRMFKSVDKNFKDMQDWSKRRATDMYKGVRGSIDALTGVIYEGMSYISKTANKGLKAFDADTVNMSLSPPPRSGQDEGRATGGYVGQPGERGRDRIRTWLGRGEAVLNSAHQAYIAPAVEAFYGHSFGDTFKRVRGWHAGGQEQPGYASGGIVPVPGMPGESIAKQLLPAVLAILRKYRAQLTDGWAAGGHSQASDHYWGGAVDLVPGAGGSWGLLDRLAKAAGWKPGAPTPSSGPFRWIGWNTEANHGAPPRPNAHLHLSWNRGGPFTGPAGGDFVDEVKKRMVKGGTKQMRELAQKVIEKVRKGANKHMSEEMMTGLDSITSQKFAGGAMSKTEVQRVISDAMEMLNMPTHIRSAWMNMALKRAWQESTFNPNAQNNWDSNAAAGTPSIGLFQTIGPTFGSYMMPGHNNIRNPLDNTLAAFRYMRARYGSGDWSAALAAMQGISGGYAMGGQIPGPDGFPTPILAHAGEWVLNKMQQSKLAQMMGFGVDKLRSALGFTGGPGSFAGGGEVREGAFGNRAIGLVNEFKIFEVFDKIDKYEEKIAGLREKNKTEEIKKEQERHQKWMSNLDKEIRAMARRYQAAGTPEAQRIVRAQAGDYTMPTVLPRGRGGIESEINLAQQAMRKMGKGIGTVSDAMSRYIKNLGAIVDDGGLLDQMAGAIERLGAELERQTAFALAGLRRRSGGLGAGLRRGRRGRVMITRTPEPEYRPLTPGQRIAIQNVGTYWMDRPRPRQVSVRATEVNTLTSEIQNLNKMEDAIRLRIREARNTLRNVNNKIREIKKGGVTKEEQKEYEQLMGRRNKLLDTINEGDAAIAQNLIEQQDKRRERFEAQTRQLLRPTERNQVWQDMLGRIGSALGNQNLQNQVAKNTLTNLQEQESILAKRAKDAAEKAKKDPRWQQIADDLADQWANKTAEIVELRAKILSDFIAQMEEKFAQRSTQLDLRGRFDDVRERMGDRRGAAADRIEISRQRGSLMQEQMRGYQFAFSLAQQQGNQGVMKDLYAKMEELKLQMMENVAATMELVVASRQLSVDLLRGQVESETGFIGSAIGIVQKIAEISGASNRETLLRFYESLSGTLRTAATDIAGSIMETINDPNDPFGSFSGPAESLLGQLREAFMAGPSQYADRLVELADEMANLEMGMPDPMRQLFRALVDSMTQNTEATLDNNQQLAQLNGQEPQEWASTAWQQFRVAVFNGMGGLLPQYATTVPSMDDGGQILRSGALVGHIGETILPAQIRRSSTDNSRNGDVHLHLTEPMEVADPLAIAKRTAWELKTANTL